MDIFTSVNPQEIKINENGELLALKRCTVKILLIYIHLICYHIFEKVTNKHGYEDFYSLFFFAIPTVMPVLH